MNDELNDEINARVRVKRINMEFFLDVIMGMVIGGCVSSLSFYLIVGNKGFEIICLISLGITALFGTGIIFLVCLVNFFKTYTIIKRAKLRQLKENNLGE